MSVLPRVVLVDKWVVSKDGNETKRYRAMSPLSLGRVPRVGGCLLTAGQFFFLCHSLL